MESWSDAAELLGDDFVKFFVCSHHKWNPYSDEVKNIPDIYWILQFHITNLELNSQWDRLFRPTAELTGQIANPHVYKAYYESVQRERRKKEFEKKNKDNKMFFEESGKDISSEYYHSEAEANSHYDPNLGLVSNDGRIIIPKEEYDKLIGLDGVAISY